MNTTMENYKNFAQLFLRTALGLGFLYPVLDRIGFTGPPGTPNTGWGNWENFTAYTHTLLPFLSRPISDVMALVATWAETCIGIFLIAGFQTRITALASSLLLLFFALAMAMALGIKAPFNYSVFAAAGGALLLSTVTRYRWSIDELFQKKNP